MEEADLETGQLLEKEKLQIDATGLDQLKDMKGRDQGRMKNIGEIEKGQLIKRLEVDQYHEKAMESAETSQSLGKEIENSETD